MASAKLVRSSCPLGENFKASPGRTRYFRLETLLKGGGTSVLRELLEHIIAPANLATILNRSDVYDELEKLRRRRVLKDDQWELLFPLGPICVQSTFFDITLLVILLRQKIICNLTPPSTGWDNLPNITDVSLAADIVRIKYYRNSIIAHINEKMTLRNEEFDDYWTQVKESLLRIVGFYAPSGPSTVNQYENAIDDLLTISLTEDSGSGLKSDVQEKPTGVFTLRCILKLARYGAWLGGTLYVLNWINNNPDLLADFVHNIFPGISVESIDFGSIVVQLRAEGLNAMDELRKRYDTGVLRTELETFMITEELKSLADGESIEFTVELDEEEYITARQYHVCHISTKEYTEEELNFFKVCYISTHIIADGLRQVFKREWDMRYKATHGQWLDTAKNGIDFYKMESPRYRKRNARAFLTLRSGSTSEWDTTVLFAAILFSDSIGASLNTAVKKSVEDLRELRNSYLAYTMDTKLPELEFQLFIQKVIAAFRTLKLDTTAIEEIKKQKSVGIKNRTTLETKEIEELVSNALTELQISIEKYTEEELNFFKVCYISIHIIAGGLRQVFKREWDMRYKATHGQWLDTAKNGIDFYNMESPRYRKRNARAFLTLRGGSTSEWDTTVLFTAILFSDSIGASLNTAVKKSVNDLRELRNSYLAHTMDAKLSELEFQLFIQKVITAFQTLKLDINAIKEIKRPLQKESKLQKESEGQKELQQFCVLPPKPSHMIIDRLDEVAKVCKAMEQLSTTNPNEITVVYLSGNPGCGKSEIARQIGEKVFLDTSKEDKFVVTLYSSSMDQLLESYIKFARRINCDEDSITQIITSNDLSQEDKLVYLKGLTAPQVQKYSSWLIIVDDVKDIKSASRYVPLAGEKTKSKGQVLVTTQDSQSISLDPYTYHLSLSGGMHRDEAIRTLSKLSQLSTDDDIAVQVAEVLDFQPLAVACAASYMRSASRTDPSVTWKEYLKTLLKGIRQSTEIPFVKTSLAYPKAMMAAVRKAVTEEINEDLAKMHAFQFLSSGMTAPDKPISLNIVVQYAASFMPDRDEENIAAVISSSSLILTSEEESKGIFLHQVVYDCLRTDLMPNSERDVELILSSGIF